MADENLGYFASLGSLVDGSMMDAVKIGLLFVYWLALTLTLTLTLIRVKNTSNPNPNPSLKRMVVVSTVLCIRILCQPFRE